MLSGILSTLMSPSIPIPAIRIRRIFHYHPTSRRKHAFKSGEWWGKSRISEWGRISRRGPRQLITQTAHQVDPRAAMSFTLPVSGHSATAMCTKGERASSLLGILQTNREPGSLVAPYTTGINEEQCRGWILQDFINKKLLTNAMSVHGEQRRWSA